MSFMNLLNLKHFYDYIWWCAWTGTKQWNVIIVSIVVSGNQLILPKWMQSKLKYGDDQWRWNEWK